MYTLFINRLLSNEVLEAFCWTLVHSLWQGLLAAVAAGCIVIFTKKSSARLRYNLLCLILFLFFIASGITYYFQIIQHKLSIPHTNAIVINQPGLSSNTVQDAIPVDGVTNLTDILAAWLNTYAGFIALAWALFFVAKCTKLFSGLIYIHRIRHYRTFPAASNWNDLLISLCDKLKVRKPVGLLQSGKITVPVALGFFKPVILVPLGMLSQLPPDQVETILLHELAHIRRKDYLVNIMQSCTEAIFFFNPALLWISSLIREERESCCDDIVMDNATHQSSYFDALVSFQEFSLSSNAYAMSLGGPKTYLLNRVKRLLTRENKKLNIMEKVVLLAGLIAIATFGFIPPKEAVADRKPAAIVHSNNNYKVPPVAQVAPVATPHRKSSKRVSSTATIAATDTIPVRNNQQKNANDLKDNKNNTDFSELHFSSIHINSDNDGKKGLETVTATDQNNQTYAFQVQDGQITSLSINGVSVATEDLAGYNGLYQKIKSDLEQARREKQQRMQLVRQQKLERMQVMRVHLDSLRMEKRNKMEISRAKQREEMRLVMLKRDSSQMLKHQRMQLALLKTQQKNQERLFRLDSARMQKQLHLERKTLELQKQRYQFNLQRDSMMQQKIRQQKIRNAERFSDDKT